MRQSDFKIPKRISSLVQRAFADADDDFDAEYFFDAVVGKAKYWLDNTWIDVTTHGKVDFGGRRWTDKQYLVELLRVADLPTRMSIPGHSERYLSPETVLEYVHGKFPLAMKASVNYADDLLADAHRTGFTLALHVHDTLWDYVLDRIPTMDFYAFLAVCYVAAVYAKTGKWVTTKSDGTLEVFSLHGDKTHMVFDIVQSTWMRIIPMYSIGGAVGVVACSLAYALGVF